MSESGQDWGLTIAVAIAASAVTSAAAAFITRHFDRRGAFREKTRETCDLINKLEEAGGDYWARSANDDGLQALAAKIRGLDGRISSKLRVLKKSFLPKQTDFNILFLELRQSVSDGQFEVKGRAPQLDRHERIQSAAVALEEAIESTKIRLF